MNRRTKGQTGDLRGRKADIKMGRNRKKTAEEGGKSQEYKFINV